MEFELVKLQVDVRNSIGAMIVDAPHHGTPVGKTLKLETPQEIGLTGMVMSGNGNLIIRESDAYGGRRELKPGESTYIHGQILGDRATYYQVIALPNSG